MKKDIDKVARAISLIENGPYTAVGDYKKYRNELRAKGYFLIDTYKIEEKDYCWLVWFDTDFGTEPQFKGRPLLKIVPKYTLRAENEIRQVLDLQGWAYI